MEAEKTVGKTINGLKPGAFVALGKVGTNDGSVEARRLTTGSVHLYWRVTFEGKTKRFPIGAYDAKAPPRSLEPTTTGYSVRAATRAAEGMAREHRDSRDIGGYEALQLRRRQEREQAAADAVDAMKYSLKALLTDYCEYLKTLGRKSHRDAASIFKCHIYDVAPKFAALPAREVTDEQFADLMRKVFEAGKGRTANKLRAYARSAYQIAKAAKSNASIPVAFKAYGITHNPVGDTSPDHLQNKADKNPLKADDLRTYWRLLQGVEGFKGALLRLHLLSGGQRIEQFVTLLESRVEPNLFVLLDGKGRPGQPPRPHAIPITKAMRKELDACAAWNTEKLDARIKEGATSPAAESAFAFSTDGGYTHVAATTLSAWAVEVTGKKINDFKAKRIRSGVETLLASARISAEHRGRLQSHGISGVQSRHYDDHDYFDEKLAALNTLHRLLERKDASNVVPMPKQAA
jgi:hypothetical protein